MFFIINFIFLISCHYKIGENITTLRVHKNRVILKNAVNIFKN